MSEVREKMMSIRVETVGNRCSQFCSYLEMEGWCALFQNWAKATERVPACLATFDDETVRRP